MSLSFDEVLQLLAILPPNTPVTLNVNVDVTTNSGGGTNPPPPVQSDAYVVDTSGKTNNRAKIFDKPSKGSNEIGFVYKDEIVLVDSTRNSYYHVYQNTNAANKDFLPGWVEEDYLRKV